MESTCHDMLCIKSLSQTFQFSLQNEKLSEFPHESFLKWPQAKCIKSLVKARYVDVQQNSDFPKKKQWFCYNLSWNFNYMDIVSDSWFLYAELNI